MRLTQRSGASIAAQRRLAFLLMLMVGALLASVWANDASGAGNGPPGQGTIPICHNDGVNPPFTMDIVEPSWAGHAVHGDALGECPATQGGGAGEGEKGGYTICHRLPEEARNDWVVLNDMPLSAWEGKEGDDDNGHEGHEGDRLLDKADGTAADCDAPPPGPTVTTDTKTDTSSGTVAIVDSPAPGLVQSQSAAARSKAACGSRRSFRIRVRTRRNDPVVKAVVSVNGKTVKTLRGSRITAPVVLTGLPKGRYTVKIVATTKSGKKKSGSRRYLTCTPKRPGGIPPL